MARAKNTQRSEARRRYRQEVRVNTLRDDATVEDDGDLAIVSSTGDQAAAATPARQSMFTRPDFKGDIQALPQLLRSRAFFIPLILLGVAFLIAALYLGNVLQGVDTTPLSLALALAIQPGALFVPFIGGFLAPRGAYLLGVILGGIQGVIYVIVLLWIQGSPLATTGTTTPTATTDLAGTVISGIVICAVYGTLASAFASWYRRFLRQSQDRAKANRALREQQVIAKKKEQERADRLAARDARRTSATKKSTS